MTLAGKNDASRVLVTRPARDARHWVEALQKSGFQAEALPLIDIAPVSAPQHLQALEEAWQSLGSYSACMFVSGNAVDCFFKQKQAAAQDLRPQHAIKNIADETPGTVLPPGLRFLAPGPGTAAALLAAGVSAAQIDSPPLDAAQFDSEALWRVIGQQDWAGRRVLVIRGLGEVAGLGALDESTGQSHAVSAGRDWITRQWQAAGASVDIVCSYERRVPVFEAAQLQRVRTASADGSVWIFSSSEAIANLGRLTEQPSPAMDWSGAVAVATHPRIAATARAFGWGRVVESRPALQDIARTLASIGEACVRRPIE
jgi:uroporphyrinogen-III synthase